MAPWLRHGCMGKHPTGSAPFVCPDSLQTTDFTELDYDPESSGRTMTSFLLLWLPIGPSGRRYGQTLLWQSRDVCPHACLYSPLFTAAVPSPHCLKPHPLKLMQPAKKQTMPGQTRTTVCFDIVIGLTERSSVLQASVSFHNRLKASRTGLRLQSGCRR